MASVTAVMTGRSNRSTLLCTESGAMTAESPRISAMLQMFADHVADADVA